MKNILLLLIAVTFYFQSFSQQTQFPYSIEILPVQIEGLPGLHSYAYAEHEGKWLIIGGRRDGLHARQPFNAFPASQNNTEMFVIDIQGNQFWSANIESLTTPLREQLQSTNMLFFQDNDTLYFAGGYAFSATENDHITFPSLISVDVPGLVNAIIANTAITPFFKQIQDDHFALCGGQMGKLGDYYYLVGGHRFDGRYNPMGNPTYTQTYSNQIRKMKFNNAAEQLSFSDYTEVNDAVHLHRRDYNLLAQRYPDGDFGYLISSGVFQSGADLPYLYPVDIRENAHEAFTNFNQYLSNYHSAKVNMYDSLTGQMQSLFLGGMSRYYYDNDVLMQDDNVPFVKTISLLTRFEDNSFEELALDVEMPGFKGASAEFLLNMNLPNYNKEIVKMHEIMDDTILLGHVFGGIRSESENPFTFNQTSTTSADPTLYRVSLIRENPVKASIINGENPYSFELYPNPTHKWLGISFDLRKKHDVRYFITDTSGRILQEGLIDKTTKGKNKVKLDVGSLKDNTMAMLTLVFEDYYFVTRRFVKQ